MNALVLPPEVPEPTVGPDLLQPLQIFSQLVVQTVSQNLKQKRDFSFQSMKKVRSVSSAATAQLFRVTANVPDICQRSSDPETLELLPLNRPVRDQHQHLTTKAACKTGHMIHI